MHLFTLMHLGYLHFGSQKCKGFTSKENASYGSFALLAQVLSLHATQK